ncbi:MAG: hypothetical protein ACK55I_41820, partial [bacterium]
SDADAEIRGAVRRLQGHPVAEAVPAALGEVAQGEAVFGVLLGVELDARIRAGGVVVALEHRAVGVREGQEGVEARTERSGLHLDDPALVGRRLEAEDVRILLGADAALDDAWQGEDLRLLRGVVGFRVGGFLQVTHLEGHGVG